MVSIGTGSAPGRAFKGNLRNIVQRMSDIVTETERTENDFSQAHPEMAAQRRLFRFNVYHGLAEVGLEEYRQVAMIKDRTDDYLARWETMAKLEACVNRLRGIVHPEPLESLPPLIEVHVQPPEHPFEGRNYNLTVDNAWRASLDLQNAGRHEDAETQGKWTEAEELLQQALQAETQTLGANDHYTLQTQARIGELYLQWGRLPVATQSIETVLLAQENALPQDDKDTLSTMSQLATAHARQDPMSVRAKDLYERVLRGLEATPDDPMLWKAMSNLAISYRDLGRHDDAQRLFERALRGLRNTYGASRPEALNVSRLLDDL